MRRPHIRAWILLCCAIAVRCHPAPLAEERTPSPPDHSGDESEPDDDAEVSREVVAADDAQLEEAPVVAAEPRAYPLPEEPIVWRGGRCSVLAADAVGDARARYGPGDSGRIHVANRVERLRDSCPRVEELAAYERAGAALYLIETMAGAQFRLETSSVEVVAHVHNHQGGAMQPDLTFVVVVPPPARGFRFDLTFTSCGMCP